MRDSVWTDTRPLADSVRVIRVQPFSDAYFALTRRLPELAPLFALGERVRVHGRRVAIEVTAKGVTTLDTAALEAVARDW
jgi:hypothetical protein